MKKDYTFFSWHFWQWLYWADVAQMAQESLRRILSLRSRMYRRQKSVKDLYTAAPLL